jgi:hypothetical protein
LLLLLALAAPACADDLAAGGGATVIPGADVFPGFDAGAGLPDVGVPFDIGMHADLGAGSDAAAADAVRPDSLLFFGDPGPLPDALLAAAAAKSDDVYLVPFEVTEKRHLTLKGGRAAWIERSGTGTLALVTWAFAADDASPLVHELPYQLQDPRQLVMTDSWLFWVDDLFGDPDVFGLRLTDGAFRLVVAQVGPQEAPSADGGVVAWQDCRFCVAGAPDPAPEIFRRDVGAAGLEERVTSDDLPDRAPTFGTLADGSLALAWISADTTLRVVGAGAGGVDASFPAPDKVAGVALTEGQLAFRAEPAIINPDSMMPADVMLVDVASGVAVDASVHSELWPALPAEPVAAGGLIAWAEAVPDPVAPAGLPDPTSGRVRAVFAADPTAQAGLAQAQGIREIAISPGALGFIAPRADNEGMNDVWILPLP